MTPRNTKWAVLGFGSAAMFLLFLLQVGGIAIPSGGSLILSSLTLSTALLLGSLASSLLFRNIRYVQRLGLRNEVGSRKSLPLRLLCLALPVLARGTIALTTRVTRSIQHPPPPSRQDRTVNPRPDSHHPTPVHLLVTVYEGDGNSLPRDAASAFQQNAAEPEPRVLAPRYARGPVLLRINVSPAVQARCESPPDRSSPRSFPHVNASGCSIITSWALSIDFEP